MRSYTGDGEKGLPNQERGGLRVSRLSEVLRLVDDRTHVDVDFVQRSKEDPYQVDFFAEVKDQADGDWWKPITVGKWSLARQMAWSWSAAHPDRPPAIGMIVYIRTRPEPQLRVQAYYPNIEVAERKDIFSGEFSELTEMDVERFCAWCESLPEKEKP